MYCGVEEWKILRFKHEIYITGTNHIGKLSFYFRNGIFFWIFGGREYTKYTNLSLFLNVETHNVCW